MNTPRFFIAALFLLFSACDKRAAFLEGTWQSKNYDALIRIEKQGEVFFVSLKAKDGKQLWIAPKAYKMYYDKGVLRSNAEGFNSITYHKEHNTISVNNETEEWSKTEEKASM